MILCCGEALIDMLPRKSTAGEPAFAPYPGGAVFNSAIALGRLGAKPGFLCGLSTDMFGRQLTETLEAAGVDHSLCPRADLPTTLAFVELVDGQARYAFYDENTAARSLTEDRLPDLPNRVHALLFGGISLVSEPCGGTLEALMLDASATRVTMVDPNIRPGFITDEETYRARIARMLAAADIVKLSDEDLFWLTGDGADAYLHDLLAGATSLIVLTEGAKGARVLTTSGEDIFVPAQKVEVVDTVGAGDTLNAAVLWALQEAGTLNKDALSAIDAETARKAVETGVRAAAITVSRAGANPPTAAELG
ncbi:carbohydrate kinase [Actibacterium mucosum KCTC 23349]|uniref:Carbohydrate kinase n=1 Tax=Actibacterium mucosum KCTC 23349 TaxID=1454373 RepID=A0A037ZLQ6_9RHOB|nr:carbohydrate kinase [Actibacterium mucosum]KAJ56452.1 carbohydrate kinase [Actibacterium mucosum KCTC 23349]